MPMESSSTSAEQWGIDMWLWKRHLENVGIVSGYLVCAHLQELDGCVTIAAGKLFCAKSSSSSMRTAVIFGGESRDRFHVVVTAKSSSTQSDKKHPPGTIESVRDEILASGGSASCRVCDVRDAESIAAVISDTIAERGGVDDIIYNAGAIWWGPVKDTSLKRYDLMEQINPRGLYAAVSAVLPHFLARGTGRIISISPPIYSRFFRGKTAYAMGKVGMSVLTIGLAMDFEGTGIAISALWPATAIQSAVTDAKALGTGYLRKPEIFADATLHILKDDAKRVNGQTFVDEDYLRHFQGVKDFTKYRLSHLTKILEDPDKEPPRMLPKEFPSLLVAEQEDRGISLSSVRSKL
ncbi:hypothetical protein BC829DRAFT_431409 [Chytridium lagenaria]|nr:hypothetical protein BC829DRAFT_431409 [Chytridium lagenaria]